jgi:protein-disulfide isomerase
MEGRDTRRATALGVNSTPTFFHQRPLAERCATPESFKQMIDQELGAKGWIRRTPRVCTRASARAATGLTGRRIVVFSAPTPPSFSSASGVRLLRRALRVFIRA